MPGQGRPARDETGWRAGDVGCRGGDVGHRPLDAAPPTGGARPRGAGQQPAAAGVLAALARVTVGCVERLSGAVRLKQMFFLHNTCILVGLGLEYAVPYLCNPLDPPMAVFGGVLYSYCWVWLLLPVLAEPGGGQQGPRPPDTVQICLVTLSHEVLNID